MINEASTQFSAFDQKIMSSSGNGKGEYNINDKPVIGSQASLGYRLVDKQGKDADIENLIDMWE